MGKTRAWTFLVTILLLVTNFLSFLLLTGSFGFLSAGPRGGCGLPGDGGIVTAGTRAYSIERSVSGARIFQLLNGIHLFMLLVTNFFKFFLFGLIAFQVCFRPRNPEVSFNYATSG